MPRADISAILQGRWSAKNRYIGFDETCVFVNVTMTTAYMTERRRRPIVFKGAFAGKTLVIFALICNEKFPM
jgi:hypothetical protein